MEVLKDSDGAEFGISRHEYMRRHQARLKINAAKRREAFRQMLALRPIEMERVEPRFRLFATSNGRLAYQVVKSIGHPSSGGPTRIRPTSITLPYMSIQG